MAGVTVLALATVGAPQVAADRAARTEAIAPQVTYDGSRTDLSNLRMIDPAVPQGRRWNGHPVVRQYFATGTSSLTAPGVRQMPAAGEYVASPALVDLIDRDQSAAALFEGITRTGVIDSAGLVQPHELRAVMGISGDPRTPLLVEVEGFGGPPPQALEDTTNLNRLVSFFVLALVWLPVGAFIVVISRLSSQQRSRRARTLRQVGMSRRSVLLLHGVEAAVICTPAALAAALVYDRFVVRVDSVPGTQIGFFGGPARAGWLVSAIVIVLVIGTFAASAAVAIRRAFNTVGETTLTVQPAAALRRSRGTKILCGGLGLLILAPLLVKVVSGGIGFSSLWIGCVLVALGTGTTGAALVVQAMRSTSTRLSSASAFVGLRLGAVETGSLRLASMFSVIVILLLGGLAFMNVLNGGSSRGWDERLATQQHVPVVVNDLVGNLNLQDVRAIAPGTSAIETRQIQHGKQEIPVVFASCADLEKLTGVAVRDCSDRPQWIAAEGTPPRPKLSGAIRLPSGVNIQTPADSEAEIKMPGQAVPDVIRGALLIPADLAPVAPTYESANYLLLVKNANLERVMARLSSRSPQLQFDLGELDYHNPDTLLFPSQVRWLTVGTILGLLLGVAAIAAAGLGEAGQRSSRMRGLRILGARRQFILTSHLWSTVTPIATLGLASTIIGWLVCTAMKNVDDRAAVQPSTFAWTALGVLVAAFVVGLITFPAVTRRSAHNAAVEA
ncbi:hypothetical protein [Aeromicrobium sp.]|uniref:FtsX-like permease family protein n=1 Tax=Aeromicrobium sp. TaxID=1871063 RepID=UPI0030C0EB6F